MATPRLETCALADLPLPQVLHLLAAERRQWVRRLSWDAGDASDAVVQAARHGILPGVAVTVDRRAVGYLGCLVTPGLFRFCGIHLEEGAPALAADLLVGAALGPHAARDRRAEGQLMAFDFQGAVDAALRQRGFQVVPRSYMTRPLGGADRMAGDGARLAGVELVPLDRGRLSEAARVLVAAHAEGIEAVINSAFRAHGPALAYLREVTGGSGCGVLHPAASRAAVVGSRVAGFCVATTIGEGVGHVPQVAVDPDAAGRGIGALLLRHAMGTLAGQGARLVTLGVSCDNARAASWYERLGFTEAARFSACFRDGE